MTSTECPKEAPMSYTLITVDEAPFDAFPSYREGGPAKVVIGGWSVSYETLDRLHSSPSVVAADDGGVTLHARRVLSREKHALDGTRYQTMRDAERAAYEAALTGFYVKKEQS